MSTLLNSLLLQQNAELSFRALSWHMLAGWLRQQLNMACLLPAKACRLPGDAQERGEATFAFAAEMLPATYALPQCMAARSAHPELGCRLCSVKITASTPPPPCRQQQYSSPLPLNVLCCGTYYNLHLPTMQGVKTTAVHLHLSTCPRSHLSSLALPCSEISTRWRLHSVSSNRGSTQTIAYKAMQFTPKLPCADACPAPGA